MVVGVIGTGAIGQKVIKNLSGFGCQILAYDPFEKEEVRKYADYVAMEEINLSKFTRAILLIKTTLLFEKVMK